jgi:hypothetical protein
MPGAPWHGRTQRLTKAQSQARWRHRQKQATVDPEVALADATRAVEVLLAATRRFDLAEAIRRGEAPVMSIRTWVDAVRRFAQVSQRALLHMEHALGQALLAADGVSGRARPDRAVRSGNPA